MWYRHKAKPLPQELKGTKFKPKLINKIEKGTKIKTLVLNFKIDNIK